LTIFYAGDNDTNIIADTNGLTAAPGENEHSGAADQVPLRGILSGANISVERVVSTENNLPGTLIEAFKGANNLSVELVMLNDLLQKRFSPGAQIHGSEIGSLSAVPGLQNADVLVEPFFFRSNGFQLGYAPGLEATRFLKEQLKQGF
jgi:hypothetical protein